MAFLDSNVVYSWIIATNKEKVSKLAKFAKFSIVCIH